MAYPQWAGQLRFAASDPDGGRQGRLELSYGSPSDPGVECILAAADVPMSAMLPPDATARHWDATHVDSEGLLDPGTDFALHDAKTCRGLPCVKVQLTSFTDGGTAVAVGVVHSLADAAALLTFAKDWAGANRALPSSNPVPEFRRPFNPSLIDAAAAGNVAATSPDPSILAAAATLPVHRFDHWASAGPSTPTWALPLTEIPPALASRPIELGTPIPYHTWDTAAPCSRATFFFSAADTHAIYLRAAAGASTRISHQDALLAHLWAALIRARGLPDGAEHFLDVSIDARRRLRTPLPPSFIGSPVLNVGVRTSAGAGADDVAGKAAAIRDCVARFDGGAVGALLHEMCFELGGQRRWNCCLGDRHVVVTSWVGVGVGGVVFEEGRGVRWAEALMPLCDGVVVVGEGGVGGGGGGGGDGGGGRWWSQGVNVGVYLRSDVMRRLMEDEGVGAFAGE